MRQILLSVTFIISFSAFGQTANDSPVIRDISIFYTDTVDNKVTLGDIKATGVIGTPDNGYLISTIFSIDFSEAFDTVLLETDIHAFSAKWKFYNSKSHIRSGSVLKFNQNLEKEWEIKLKDRGITDIMKLDDEYFLISGNRIDKKKFWAAKLKFKDGSIQWLKEFKIGYDVSVSDSKTDKNGNIYILGETQRLKPIQIKKTHNRRKVSFFKVTDNRARLTLTKVSATGNKMWTKSIDSRKYNHFGYALCLAPDKIFASGTYGQEIDIYTLTLSGKIITKIMAESADLLTYDSGLIFSRTKMNNDTLKIFRLTNSIDHISTLVMNSDKKDIRIESMLTGVNQYYLYGSMWIDSKDYMLCSLNSKYQPESYWVYQKAGYDQILDLIEMGKDRLLIVGWCYSNSGDKIHSYINLVEVKKMALNAPHNP